MTGEPWDDDRLRAAYRDRPAGEPPVKLVENSVSLLRPRRAAWPFKRAAALIGIAALVTIWLLVTIGAPRWSPDGLAHYDRSGLAFDYPAGWQQRDATVLVILGTLPVPPACGLMFVDVNCYYGQRLEPGTISVRVSGNAGARGLGGPIVAQRPENAINRDLVIGGMPALFSDFDGLGPDDYYQADEVFRWVITRPDDVGRGWSIEADLRGPGVETMAAQLTALMASVRIDGAGQRVPGGGSLPDSEILRRALDKLAAGYRRTYGQRDDDGRSMYDCFPRDSSGRRDAQISHGPNGPLGGELAVACSTDLGPAGGPFRDLVLTVDWAAFDGLAAGAYVERRWLTPAGDLAGHKLEGDPFPPVRGPRTTAEHAVKIGLLALASSEPLFNCFPDVSGTSRKDTITSGPGAVTTNKPLDVTCSTEIEPIDRQRWLLTLGVAWDEEPGAGAGRYTIEVELLPDGTPTDVRRASGDPFPYWR